MTTPQRRTIRVELGPRSYDVIVGQGLLGEIGARAGDLFPRKRTVVVADAEVARRHGDTLRAGLSAQGVDADFITLEPGEERKSFADFERLVEDLLARNMDRNEAIVAFGGGVVGDLAGFAASAIKRGVPFVQIPTTVLAQVDSSVGGKTGINARAGKNMVGAFHQPSLVLADIDTLATLPERDVRAGYAEIIKTALLDGEDFTAWLEAHGAAFLAGDPAARIEAIARSVTFKARVVEEDERETGRRALLNLGHTFAHAFEAEAGYQAGPRHGEAVAVGCVLAADYAAATGMASAEHAARTRKLVSSAGLPATPRELAGGPFNAEALLARMSADKKNRAGRIRLVLSRAPGECEIVEESDPARLQSFLEEQVT